MKKKYIPIIFLVCSVNSNTNASNLKIPENSNCVVHLGKPDNTFSTYKESSENAVIICRTTKKPNNNYLNYMNASIIHKLADNYHLYRFPSDTKRELTSGGAGKKSI